MLRRTTMFIFPVILCLVASTAASESTVSCERWLDAKRAARIARGLRAVLWFRYRTKIVGLDEVRARGTEGILMLAQHEGANDPGFLLGHVGRYLPLRPVMTTRVTEGPVGGVLKFFLGQLRGVLIDDVNRDPELAPNVRSTIERAGAALARGDNEGVWPSAALQQSIRERVAGRGFVEMILGRGIRPRVVLVKVRGLWGSEFSHGARSSRPEVKLESIDLLRRGLLYGAVTILGNAIFWVPKRPVTLEFFEPDDFPFAGTREEIDDYLEKFYNGGEPEERVFIKRFFWQRGPVRTVSSEVIDYGSAHRDESREIKAKVTDVDGPRLMRVLAILARLLEKPSLDPEESLEHAGLDSLRNIELIAALNEQFGLQLTTEIRYDSAAAVTMLVERALRGR